MMKRPVSFVSLVLAAGLLAGCGAQAVGKSEFAELCTKRMGSADKCSCYADTVEKGLTPELFTRVANGAHQMRNMAGSEWIPSTVTSDEAVSAVLAEATSACFT
jgi:hypothetical protein